MLGGAVGGALGAPVAHLSLADIRRRFGREGLTDYVEAYGRLGAITDDTQMSLFSADGVVRAYVRACLKGICAPEAIVQHAYLRWLLTQGVEPHAEIATSGGTTWPDGWLVRERRLWARRAPGKACLAALSATVTLGERAKNDCKGCATVTRVAPVGLVCRAYGDDGSSPAYELGTAVSAVTHGHPVGIVAGGAFALLVAYLTEGLEFRRAVDTLVGFLRRVPGAEVVTRAVATAQNLVEQGREATPEEIESLGGGWVAEEALGVAVYCALRAESFEHGVLLAVNHSGASDSTASLTGQLLGATLGAGVVPAHWLAPLELRDVIEEMAAALVAVRNETFDPEKEWSRFPGW
jgi:ADP-ribosylglycohydrolase